jgi:hypothetical protein
MGFSERTGHLHDRFDVEIAHNHFAGGIRENGARSMTVAAARICGVGCTAAAIGLVCAARRKRLKTKAFTKDKLVGA